MNIKRGLKRISVVVSVIWVILFYFGTYGEMTIELFIISAIGVLIVWWGILYMGFWITPLIVSISKWVVSGFSGGEKKESEIDE